MPYATIASWMVSPSGSERPERLHCHLASEDTRGVEKVPDSPTRQIIDVGILDIKGVDLANKHPYDLKGH